MISLDFCRIRVSHRILIRLVDKIRVKKKHYYLLVIAPPAPQEVRLAAAGQGGCKSPGCHGIGHVRGLNVHKRMEDCPYYIKNLSPEIHRDRLAEITNSAASR